MSNRFARPAAALLAVAGLLLATGCAETAREEATGKGSIRGINSIVDAPELSFRIEQRTLASISFRGVAGLFDYDDLSYDFNFQLLLPGQTQGTRLASQFIDVVADTEYTLVLTGTLANPSILMWEEAERSWAGTETVFEADFVHISPLLGQVDVYFVTTGTAPVLGNEIGTLSNGQRVAYREFPAGDYELILTVPDQPGMVLFQSAAVTRAGATRVTYALFDRDRSITAGVGVSAISPGGTSQTLADVNSPPLVRLYHAAFGTENVDGYYDDDFGTVVFPDVGFAEMSAYADAPIGTTHLTLTPVGNSGAVIHERDISPSANSLRTLFLTGEPGDLSIVSLANDARALATFPVTRITNTVTNFDSLDIYILAPGTPIDADVLPRFIGITPGLSTSFFIPESGMREITITANGDKVPVSAPLVLDLANGDIVDMVMLDTVDPAVVEVRVIDSNQ